MSKFPLYLKIELILLVVAEAIFIYFASTLIFSPNFTLQNAQGAVAVIAVILLIALRAESLIKHECLRQLVTNILNSRITRKKRESEVKEMDELELRVQLLERHSPVTITILVGLFALIFTLIIKTL